MIRTLRVLSCLLLLFSAVALSALKKEYNDIIAAYENNDYVKVETLLMALKPVTPDEKAFTAFYQARITEDPDAMITAYSKIYELYPKSEYASMAALELGIISFLNRDLNESKQWLEKANITFAPERDYWLAQIQYLRENYDEALRLADFVMKTAKDPEVLELCYFLVTDIYIQQKKFYSAQVTMSKLEQLEGHPIRKQYLNYLRGYSYEMSDLLDKALESYQKVYLQGRYSQYAFQAEERLFGLKARYGNRIDLSFIYPDSIYRPKVEPQAQDTTSTVTSDVVLPEKAVVKEDTTKVVPTTKTGIFLQIGRFSTEANAKKQVGMLKDKDVNGSYFTKKDARTITYVVVVGPYPTKDKAMTAKMELQKKDIESIVITR